MIRLSIGALALAFTLPSIPASFSTVSGPPWISIEHPVNPYDRTTKDAFLLVHAFHHGTPTNFPVSGTAEGIVKGERKSVSLEFQSTSRPGVFALNKQWSSDGTWTLLVAVTQAPEDAVYAVVDIGTNGLVSSVRVPTRSEKGHTLPARVAMSAVDASLRARAGMATERRE